jgi:DNA-binding beta-propeller fold protein YncE
MMTKFRHLIIGVVAAATLLSSVGTATALTNFGVSGFFGGRGTTGGKFPTNLGGLTVNRTGAGGVAEGDVYAANPGASRVEEFSAAGQFVRAIGLGVGGPGVNVCTVAANCVIGAETGAAGAMKIPNDVAIDQVTGTVYVTEKFHPRVDVFSATGAFEGAFGWDVNAAAGAEHLQFCTSETGCNGGTYGFGAGQFDPTGNGTEFNAEDHIAVSPLNEHVFIADEFGRRINEFAPVLEGGKVVGISFVRAYGWGVATGAAEFQECTSVCHAPHKDFETGPAGHFGDVLSPGDITVDSQGNVYAINHLGSASREIQVFDSEGHVVRSVVSNPDSQSIGIDPSTDDLLVDMRCSFDCGNEASNSETRIVRYSPSGSLLETYLEEDGIGQADAMAVGDGLDSTYLTAGLGSEPVILKLGPTSPPTAQIEPAFEITGTTARFSGSVNPLGLFTTYQFQFSRDGQKWEKLPEGSLPADSVEHPVSGEASGLEALTHYQLRLVVSHIFSSEKIIPETSFETLAAPPVALVPEAGNVTDTSATLTGEVNPENQETSYRFECVTEAQFKASGYAEATEVPSGGAAVEAAGEEVEVSQQVAGLSPSTTYRCRLAASNATGSSGGPEMSFATYASQPFGPPDGRAYEQVTPIDKNGNNAGGLEYLLKAAADGSAETYFITAGGSTEGGGQLFPSYAALRGSGGWVSHSFLPSSTFGHRARVIGWSEDLRRDYVLVWESGEEATLYEEELASGAMRAISGGIHRPGGGFFIGEGTNFAGESADGDQMLFESDVALTAGAVEGARNLYLWDRGEGSLTLVDRLPDETTPNGGAFAGSWAWPNGNPKEGGSLGGIYTQNLHVLSEDGSTAFFTSFSVNQLFARTGLGTPGAETIRVSASQKTNGTGSGGKDPRGPKKATFMEATPDGRHVFFTSQEELTNDATTGSEDQGNDLYRYDTESGQLVDLAPDPGDAHGAEVRVMLGSSADGSDVYFVANGVLAEGASAGNCTASPPTGNWQGQGTCNVYLWHEGQVSLVSRINEHSDALDWMPGNATGSTIQGMKTGRVSANGTLLFASRLSLTGYDSKGNRELYRYEPGASLQCVSCNPTGAAPPAEGGGASVQSIPAAFVKPLTPNAFWIRNLSTDGKRVFFDSTEQLVATDLNGVTDVYEWEAKGSGSCQSDTQDGGCLYLVSSGEGKDPSYFSDASKSGDDAFFFTGESLVRQDTDQLYDVYDARVDGGIAAQNQVPSSPCEGEACKGPAPTAPASATAGSASFSGPGDPSPERKHRHKKKKHAKKHHKGSPHGGHAKHAPRSGR